ncbi:MAG: TnpV protein [Clostridia bacterium]|nr:TnpV protein [Clostridia bacterium]
MENYITDERSGLNYRLVGDYYLPMIKAPETPEIGIWGQRYLRYLRENKKAIYTTLFVSGKLCDNAVEIDRIADELYNRLIREIAVREGVTEELKARDQIAWTGAMNNIAERAREIVMSEVICV